MIYECRASVSRVKTPYVVNAETIPWWMSDEQGQNPSLGPTKKYKKKRQNIWISSCKKEVYLACAHSWSGRSHHWCGSLKHGHHMYRIMYLINYICWCSRSKNSSKHKLYYVECACIDLFILISVVFYETNRENFLKGCVVTSTPPNPYIADMIYGIILV